VPLKTDYNPGEYVKVNEMGMPAELRGKVGKISFILKHYPVTVNFPYWGDVGFDCCEVDPATDVEILNARLSGK
jgi:hypothetical protein